MRAQQDIGVIRHQLFQRALSAQRGRDGRGQSCVAESQVLRELLSDAHARIRALEKTLERLAASL